MSTTSSLPILKPITNNVVAGFGLQTTPTTPSVISLTPPQEVASGNIVFGTASFYAAPDPAISMDFQLIQYGYGNQLLLGTASSSVSFVATTTDDIISLTTGGVNGQTIPPQFFPTQSSLINDVPVFVTVTDLISGDVVAWQAFASLEPSGLIQIVAVPNDSGAVFNVGDTIMLSLPISILWWQIPNNGDNPSAVYRMRQMRQIEPFTTKLMKLNAWQKANRPGGKKRV